MRPADALLRAIAIVTAATVMVGQAFQRGADGLPVAPAAMGLPAGFGVAVQIQVAFRPAKHH